jgi:hypothetical protein
MVYCREAPYSSSGVLYIWIEWRARLKLPSIVEAKMFKYFSSSVRYGMAYGATDVTVVRHNGQQRLETGADERSPNSSSSSGTCCAVTCDNSVRHCWQNTWPHGRSDRLGVPVKHNQQKLEMFGVAKLRAARATECKTLILVG